MNNKKSPHPRLDSIDMSQNSLAVDNMVALVNHIGQAVAGHRKMAAQMGVAAQMDSSIIAALIVAAGAIQGEIIELGMVEDDMSDTATHLMLVDNFAAGQEAGHRKVKRMRGELPGCDDPTCRACNPANR